MTGTERRTASNDEQHMRGICGTWHNLNPTPCTPQFHKRERRTTKPQAAHPLSLATRPTRCARPRPNARHTNNMARVSHSTPRHCGLRSAVQVTPQVRPHTDTSHQQPLGLHAVLGAAGTARTPGAYARVHAPGLCTSSVRHAHAPLYPPSVTWQRLTSPRSPKRAEALHSSTWYHNHLVRSCRPLWRRRRYHDHLTHGLVRTNGEAYISHNHLRPLPRCCDAATPKSQASHTQQWPTLARRLLAEAAWPIASTVAWGKARDASVQHTRRAASYHAVHRLSWPAVRSRVVPRRPSNSPRLRATRRPAGRRCWVALATSAPRSPLAHLGGARRDLGGWRRRDRGGPPRPRPR